MSKEPTEEMKVGKKKETKTMGDWSYWPVGVPEMMMDQMPELAALSKQSMTATRRAATRTRDAVVEQMLNGNGAYGHYGELVKTWSEMARPWIELTCKSQDMFLDVYEEQINHLIDRATERQRRP